MKKALIIGINDYPNAPLSGCENDAISVSNILESNGDGSPNFDIRLELNVKTKSALKTHIIELFSGNSDTCLLYFSGHGYLDELGGGFIVTPDAENNDLGISMDEILNYANKSECRNKVIILDCCHSGAFGTPTNQNIANIHEGVTILTASKDKEYSLEIGGHGVFTTLLLEALKGGAADLRGHITPGSIYSFIDQALGPWDQRPVFKTNISRFTSLRKTTPQIPISTLRDIINIFPTPSDEFVLDPSFEFTNDKNIEHEYKEPYASEQNVQTFKKLQQMNRVGLVRPVDEEHMYFAAMNNKACQLTALGYHYWRLIKEKRI
ncbi:caspase family protein [Leeuwenhoekiella palythoae]|uniref:caspase family protein n=1 Tax=Leeuwenhoekiella palythoae TaxID=573501 RepID=UPI001CE0B55D|nr:caspase family protein [Leeuwenhoekiella palythoae]UBZ08958.1 caspase family protein [Leeuwenhoekiella palythoae]